MRYILTIVLTLLLSVQTLLAADAVVFYHNDHVGTPLAMTDSSGNVVWQADYKPFGEEHTVAGTADNKRRFVGKEKDTESGLSYFDARYEDAKTGRFISTDPVNAIDPHHSKTNEELLLNPQRLNLYAYGLNNPYRFVDEDGKLPVPALGGLAIVALRVSQSPIGQKTADLITRSGRQIASLASQLANSRAIGALGEEAVGVGTKVRIESLTSTAKYRIPDILTRNTIEEIKNVKNLSLTRQLNDFYLYSKENGLQMVLHTRQTTDFSSSLQRLIDKGEILVKPIKFK